jgi:hypothetical protein
MALGSTPAPIQISNCVKLVATGGQADVAPFPSRQAMLVRFDPTNAVSCDESMVYM